MPAKVPNTPGSPEVTLTFRGACEGFSASVSRVFRGISTDTVASGGSLVQPVHQNAVLHPDTGGFTGIRDPEIHGIPGTGCFRCIDPDGEVVEELAGGHRRHDVARDHVPGRDLQRPPELRCCREILVPLGPRFRLVPELFERIGLDPPCLPVLRICIDQVLRDRGDQLVLPGIVILPELRHDRIRPAHVLGHALPVLLPAISLVLVVGSL